MRAPVWNNRLERATEAILEYQHLLMEAQTAKLELSTHNPESVVIPDYCRKLKVYRICEDDLPVVYVLTEPLLKEAA